MKKIFGKIVITQKEYKEYMYLRSKEYDFNKEVREWEHSYTEKFAFYRDNYEKLRDENIELKFKLEMLLNKFGSVPKDYEENEAPYDGIAGDR